MFTQGTSPWTDHKNRNLRLKRFPQMMSMMITLATHIETEKKQPTVKKGEISRPWTRRDVFLDLLEQRGICFNEMIETAAFFRCNPHLLPTMLKILNPCYDVEGFFRHRNSYYSNQSLAEKDQMIGSVRVKACSVATIKRHKQHLEKSGQLMLVERHSFKKRAPTLLNTDTVNDLDDHRTTLCIPKPFYSKFNSSVDWHQKLRECLELFSEEVSKVISYEHFEEIDLDKLHNNKLRELYGEPRITNTIFSLSKDKGTYVGSIFFKAKRKKNGELRKPRVSRLLITPARQSSLCGSRDKSGVVGNARMAFEGRKAVKPVCYGGVDPGTSVESAVKRSEMSSVGRNRINVGETTAKEKQASQTHLKASVQKHKKPRVISKQETKPLKLSDFAGVCGHVTKSAWQWAGDNSVSENGALVRLRDLASSEEAALESGGLSAKDAVTPDILDYWLAKVNPVQLLYIFSEAADFAKSNRVFSRVKFLEYRICATIKNINAYEQRKNFNKEQEQQSVCEKDPDKEKASRRFHEYLVKRVGSSYTKYFEISGYGLISKLRESHFVAYNPNVAGNWNDVVGFVEDVLRSVS